MEAKESGHLWHVIRTLKKLKPVLSGVYHVEKIGLFGSIVREGEKHLVGNKYTVGIGE
jgi:predicted nucleotidyltransferase